MDSDSRKAAVEAFQDAHRIAGGHSALARICGCTPPNIHQLIDRGSLLPAAYVLDVESATGVSRYELRPDIYPREDAPAQPPAGTSPPPAGGSRGDEGLEGLAA